MTNRIVVVHDLLRYVLARFNLPVNHRTLPQVPYLTEPTEIRTVVSMPKGERCTRTPRRVRMCTTTTCSSREMTSLRDSLMQSTTRLPLCSMHYKPCYNDKRHLAILQPTWSLYAEPPTLKRSTQRTSHKSPPKLAANE